MKKCIIEAFVTKKRLQKASKIDEKVNCGAQ